MGLLEASLAGGIEMAAARRGDLGAYMGGKAFEWPGSYDWMWYADIVLAVGAALITPERLSTSEPAPA